MFNAGSRVVNNWIYSITEGFVLIDTGYENGFTHLKKRLDEYVGRILHPAAEAFYS